MKLPKIVKFLEIQKEGLRKMAKALGTGRSMIATSLVLNDLFLPFSLGATSLGIINNLLKQPMIVFTPQGVRHNAKEVDLIISFYVKCTLYKGQSSANQILLTLLKSYPGASIMKDDC